MLTEYEMHMRLRGKPDVCQLYASFEDEANVYFVMELCTGGDAYNLVYNYGGPVPEKVVVQQVLYPLLRALQQTHEVGVIHRDVKPENIFMSPTRGGGMSAKLGDFGLACLSAACDLRPSESLGTLDYMSPEVLRLSPWLSLATRIEEASHSLGSADWETGGGGGNKACGSSSGGVGGGAVRGWGGGGSEAPGRGAESASVTRSGCNPSHSGGIRRSNSYNRCNAMVIDDDVDDEDEDDGDEVESRGTRSPDACMLLSSHSPLPLGASPVSPSQTSPLSFEPGSSHHQQQLQLQQQSPRHHLLQQSVGIRYRERKAGQGSCRAQEVTAVAPPATGGHMRAAGRGSVFTEAVDVWGVGVLAYELLCGELPFGEQSAQETCTHILCHDPPLSGSWPRCLSMQAVHFIHSALNKVPSERPTVEGLLNSPLIRKHCPQAEPVPAPAQPPENMDHSPTRM
eukprot:jgi/Mesvir1/8657/Mv02600-RA.1